MNIFGVTGTLSSISGGILYRKEFSEANTSGSNGYVTVDWTINGRIIYIHMDTSETTMETYLVPTWFPDVGYYHSSNTNQLPSWTNLTTLSKWTPYSDASYPTYLELSSDYTTFSCRSRISSTSTLYVDIVYIV